MYAINKELTNSLKTSQDQIKHTNLHKTIIFYHCDKNRENMVYTEREKEGTLNENEKERAP